jgi:hypothetical protein
LVCVELIFTEFEESDFPSELLHLNWEKWRGHRCVDDFGEGEFALIWPIKIHDRARVLKRAEERKAKEVIIVKVSEEDPAVNRPPLLSQQGAEPLPERTESGASIKNEPIAISIADVDARRAAPEGGVGLS